MNIEEIRNLSTKDLVINYKETRIKLTKMKFQNAVSQLEQPHLFKETRKQIARFLGEINRRRFETETAAWMKKNNE